MDAPPIPPPGPEPQAEKPRPRRAQVGLRTLFLLLAAVAVWLSVYTNRRQSAALESRIRMLRPLSHELVVDDPRQIAVVRKDELWMDDNRWEFYLPSGRFRLCLATREVSQGFNPKNPPGPDLSPVRASVPLGPGRHAIALVQERGGAGWRVRVSERGAVLMAVDEPPEWDVSSGSVGGGNFATCEQLPADRPVILFRRQFLNSAGSGQAMTPGERAEGILLWIEGAGGTGPAP